MYKLSPSRARLRSWTQAYLEAGDESDFRAQQRLWTMNPYKLVACKYLCKFHEQRKDKILIFCDDLRALDMYKSHLKCPAMHGETGTRDRRDTLERFRKTTGSAMLLLSRVGDVAIDLPEANVIVQVSAHFGSRMQMAQRFGERLWL